VTDLPKAGDGFASNQPSYWGTVAAGKYTTTSYKSEKAEIAVHSVKADADIVKSMAESVGKVFDYYSQRFGPPPSSNFRVVEVEGANWNAQWSIGMLLLPSSQLRKDFDLPALAATVAHQWFPLKIGVKDPSSDAWLIDGMAQFASLLYFEQTLSPAEAQEHIRKALVKALAYEGTTSIRQAGGLDKDSPDYRSLDEFQVQTDGDPEYARVEVVGESSEFEVKTERKPKLVVIDPREKILRMSSDIRIAVLVNRGEELANEGKYNDAIDQYQKAVDIDSHNSLALFRMGEA